MQCESSGRTVAEKPGSNTKLARMRALADTLCNGSRAGKLRPFRLPSPAGNRPQGTRAMAIGLLGRKVGMTQIFDEAGRGDPGDGARGRPLPHPAASQPRARRLRSRPGGLRRQAPPPRQSQPAWSCCQARQQASPAVELPPASQLADKAGCEPKRFVREFRGPAGEYKVGQQLTVDLLNGVEVGRRHRHLQGARHGRPDEAAQLQRPACHSRRQEGASPQRRHLGQHFPGPRDEGQEDGRPHWATRRARCAISRWCGVDAENNLLLVRGAVPGPNGGYVVIRQTNNCKM